jgi:hypothetical protein
MMFTAHCVCEDCQPDPDPSRQVAGLLDRLWTIEQEESALARARDRIGRNLARFGFRLPGAHADSVA